MGKQFEVRWEGELPASPQEVWDAFTVRSAGWLWKIEYEPRLGGAERGLTGTGGKVTAWDPPRRFRTRADSADGGFNQLDYLLEPTATGSYLSYVHSGTFGEDHYDRTLDACRRHTAFYYHSLGEYLAHFPGRDAVHFTTDAPAASVDGGFAAVRRALGLSDDLAAGDKVRLTPAGLDPIEGVVDYATHPFLGIRGADTLYRFFGRDEWEQPVGVALHRFADGVDPVAEKRAWTAWLAAVFAA